MSKIRWLFMSYRHKLKHTMKVLYENRQRLHLNGFILDFDTMTIEKEQSNADSN